jgi:hypothetical protein
MIPVFEGAQMVHALDHAATVFGKETHTPRENLPGSQFVHHKFHMI